MRAILIFTAMSLALGACGIKRPLMRPSQIPAYEQKRAEKMKRFEQTTPAQQEAPTRPPAPTEQPDALKVDPTKLTPLPGTSGY